MSETRRMRKHTSLGRLSYWSTFWLPVASILKNDHRVVDFRR